MSKDPYTSNQSLFVGREEVLGELRRWADLRDAHARMKALVGSSGCGKSWLLGRLREHLDGPSDRTVLFLNLSRGELDSVNILDEAQRDAWLLRTFELAQMRCEGLILKLDRTRYDFAVNLERLIAELCKRCGDRGPVLLVDGYEETLDPAGRRWLQEHILNRYLGSRCTRLVITRREESRFGLPVAAIIGQEQVVRVPPLLRPDNERQLATRAAHRDPVLASRVTDMLNLLSPYAWDHAYINAMLFERARLNRGPGQDLLTAADARYCLSQLVQGAGLSSADCLYRLLQLAQLRNQAGQYLNDWSHQDLLLQFDVNRVRDRLFHQLTELGLVFQATARTFAVVPGVLELARTIPLDRNETRE